MLIEIKPGVIVNLDNCNTVSSLPPGNGNTGKEIWFNTTGDSDETDEFTFDEFKLFLRAVYRGSYFPEPRVGGFHNPTELRDTDFYTLEQVKEIAAAEKRETEAAR